MTMTNDLALNAAEARAHLGALAQKRPVNGYN